MKKILLAVLVIVMAASLAGAEKFITVPLVEPSPEVYYRDDAIIINLAASTGKVRVSPEVAATGKFGIPDLDALAVKYSVTKVETLFPNPELTTSPGVPDMSRFYRVTFDSRAVALSDVLTAFSRSALVETAEPIGVHRLDFTPNDTYFSPGQAFGYQWDMEQQSDQDVDAATAWDINKGSTTVIVGDLDSGFRYYHRDLGGDNWTGGPSATGTTGNIWINTLDPVDGLDNDGNGFVDDHIGWDFVNGGFLCATSLGEDCSTPDNDPADFNGHGTHTAGTIAAISNNARAVAGMAGGDAGGSTGGTGNGCKIMCLRIGWHASDGNGYVSMDYAAQALNYAAAINNNPGQTAKVCAVNCSWGSSSLSALQAAIENAVAAGILICKAAGNSNNQTADFLNAKTGDTTMSVAATDSFDVKASFSSYGDWVDVSAPGVDIISTYHYYPDPAGEYVARSSGTSMSAPHVAGLAGLAKSQGSGLTRSQISSLIKDNADPIDQLQSRRHRGKMGTGRINAQKTLAAIVSPGADTSYVFSIDVTRQPANGPFWEGVASVVVKDKATGTGLSGATVTGNFSGPTSGSASGVTDATGTAVIVSDKTKNNLAQNWCFAVTNVAKSGYTYDPGLNVETSDCEAGAAASSQVRIEQSSKAAPNPFNASTLISYYVPGEAKVTLEIYNIRGQKVKTLVNQTKSVGTYSVIWDGTNANGDLVSSGVYFYNLSVGNERVTKKMTFLK